jgi:hypothetical protein
VLVYDIKEKYPRLSLYPKLLRKLGGGSVSALRFIVEDVVSDARPRFLPMYTWMGCDTPPVPLLLSPLLQGGDVEVLSPGLVAHTYSLWAKMRQAAIAGDGTLKPRGPKPMSGFFATVFATQVSSTHAHSQSVT